ncbi:glutamate receptor 2.9-like [Phragmites australis]|uniref:glutamate receptor 2.9-like n=1 Tax=Phragmites australis TaxID=29695 RepID=UPI002D772B49|nr:glutamate receptor 2.9-like [Phragmites australis]
MKAGAAGQLVAGARLSGSAALLSHLLVVILLCLASARGVAGAERGEAAAAAGARRVDVGVILDRTTWVGNISWACMELALEDFYADARYAKYSTRVRLHLRDTAGPDPVDAASAGVDLLKNVRVQAIIGPQTSSQAKFLVELGNISSVPIISFSANSPSRSPSQTPYFIRTGWNDSSQAEAIASLVQKYNWREVVPVFEDDDSNARFIPDLVDTRVSYRCKIHPLAGEDEIKGAISSLKGNWTSVFVVRMSYVLALRFFRLAKDEGMMGQGFVWIMAYGLTDIFDVSGSPALDVMNGVVGVEPYVEDTIKLQNFKQRWREKYRMENPDTKLNDPTVYGFYAYDTVWALALAAEKAGYVDSDFVLSETNNGSTDLDRISASKAAGKLHSAFLKIGFLGMTGTFQIQDWQLVSITYKIINVAAQDIKVAGFWTPEFNISGSLKKKTNLHTIIWPGGSDKAPRGWLLPMNKKLRIGVPAKYGFGGFIRYENGKAKGFCGDVFENVIQALPYDVPIHYEEFGDGKGKSSGTYDELVYKVYLKEYDAVVGDITILANRSLYVDFTLPYTESGVRMLVPVRDQRQKTAWTFLEPLTADLWLGTGAFFVFTGFIVWFIEHRTNWEFRGSPGNQFGSIFYFSFSTLVFAHRERIVNNLSRVAVLVWLFVVLILQQSYTASLSSILTVEQLRPAVTNLDEVIRQGSYVGYLNDSFLPGLLKRLKINESKMIAFNSPEEFNDALSTGRVAVIVDEIPYLKVFLSKYCHNYTMVGPTYKFDGFGYAFPRGSPLTHEISRGILQLASSDKMAQLEQQLYGDTICPDKNDSQTSSSLTLHSFLGLFIITGASSMLALILHVGITLYNHWCDLISAISQSSWRGLPAILFKIFHENDNSSNTPDIDEPRMADVDRTTESPWSTSNHIMENFDSETGMGSPPEGEGTPGREVSVQDPDPLSFAYMHSEG